MTKPTVPLYNLSKIIEMSRNNNDFVKKMVQLSINEFTNSTIKIKEAYKTGDFANLKYYAHRLKPSVLSMEIHKIKNEIVQIEALAIKGEKTQELTGTIEKLDSVMAVVIQQLKAEYKL